MHPTKVSVKLFATADQTRSLESYVPVFHRWIREGTLDELMIDVADYTHVPSGPGVLLVGHASDVSIDQGEDRPGLVYLRKRALPEGKELVKDALERVLSLAKKLELDPEVRGPKAFATTELLFRFPDRLHVENDAAGFQAVAPAIEAALGSTGLGAGYRLSREGEAREPLTVRALRL